MERINEKSNWGGYREGGGRPSTDRNVAISVRISQEANELLKQQKNKSEYIDRLIKEASQ
jgi:hypothetical protein